jgi:hypothetical protein
MGNLPPLDRDRVVDGLCSTCFEQQQHAGLDSRARIGLSMLDQVIERADARRLGWLAQQLERRFQAAHRRLRPQGVTAPRAGASQ